MKKFKTIVCNDLSFMFTIKRMLLVIVIYIFLNFINEGLYRVKSINELIKYSFYGTKNLIDIPIELIMWTFCQMILLYFILSFVNFEIKERERLVILRISSRAVWFNGIIVSAFICCVLYYAAGFVTLIVLNINLVSCGIDCAYLLKVFILMVLSSFSISLLGIVFTAFIKSEAVTFTILLFLYYLSISIDSRLGKYIIFNQGVLAKHYVFEFGFSFSYIYTVLFSLVLYFIIKNVFLRRDIF